VALSRARTLRGLLVKGSEADFCTSIGCLPEVADFLGSIPLRQVGRWASGERGGKRDA